MKIAIFIDGGYLDKILKNNSIRIDYCKLSEELSMGKTILRTYYYNCLPYQGSPPTDEEKSRFSGAQRFHRALERLPRYQVRTGKLAKRGDQYEQKGIDTLISIDLVNLSASGKISDAVLVAGDSDFNPAVRIAKEHGVNVFLCHSVNRNEYHDSLWEICDERIPIGRDFLEKIKK
ncbi:MAG: NYN domain-containing protein [Syntrophales bacterium]|nr:NYN domain-containing protein [Syntrophales bacterium]MCK9528818.1 NYN domain-containing protein [Syntrophales bacterium]MDX9921982.1 NYN domain-containing protein [Syntrophales bacterium]